MVDTVNFWIDRVDISGGKPFDILPHLSEITERQSDKSGYSCTGKVLDYEANVFEAGILLKGSLAKSYFGGENISTLKRRDVQRAIEQLSDGLHTDLNGAKVTRLDISTVIPTRRPPADYYPYLGSKARFERLQSTPDTLYYNNHQRQLIFYDKIKEAIGKGIKPPEILGNNVLRYELRYTKRVNGQLKADVKASTLYDRVFYPAIIQNWYNEFKTIQKLKNNSFMTDNITTVREAETALFTHLLQQGGQSTVDEFLNELKAKETFKERQRYYELKKKLNSMLAASVNSEKSELIREIETAIFDIAKHAR
jgi:hypothetical protein